MGRGPERRPPAGTNEAPSPHVPAGLSAVALAEVGGRRSADDSHATLLPPDKLDDSTVAYTLEVPASTIVLLQALFETYEGVAVVRTINVKRSLVSVITTPELSVTCGEILYDMAQMIPWRSVPHPEGEDIERKLGDFR